MWKNTFQILHNRQIKTENPEKMKTNEIKPCSCPRLPRSSFQAIVRWGGNQNKLTVLLSEGQVSEKKEVHIGRALEICWGAHWNLWFSPDLHVWEETSQGWESTHGKKYRLFSEAHTRLKFWGPPQTRMERYQNAWGIG